MQLEGDKGVIRHFLLDCEVRSRTSYTLVNYEHHLRVLARLLRKLFDIAELEQVTIMHLRQCVQYCLTEPIQETGGKRPLVGKMLSINSVRGYVRVWKAFFNWCYQEELLNGNPAIRLMLPKPEKKVKPTLTPEHIQRMLAACDVRTPKGFRDYVILLMLFDTGIRLSELCALRVADVHDTYIKVFGKGRKEREVGIHPEVSKLLWKYVNKYRRCDDSEVEQLFLSRQGPLSKPGLSKLLKTIQQKSGLESVLVSPHVFRHTFAKMYLSQGGDLFKLSREMGHSDVGVTKMYLEDFNSTEARREHTAFSPVESIELKKSQKKKKRQK
jgi:integrase/recombinase XerD